MAHLRSITRKCQSCDKTATVQLYGIRNTEYGYYCDRCGKVAEKALAKREERGETGSAS